MIYYIQVKIYKKDGMAVISNTLAPYRSDTILTGAEIGILVKSKNILMSTFTILEESIYIGNKKMKSTDSIPVISGIEYDIIVN